MIQTSKRSAMTAAGGLMLCLLGATVGSAAEIKVEIIDPIPRWTGC
jgi:hypothetical protein